LGKRQRRKTVPKKVKEEQQNYKKRTSEFGFLLN
jgi:hypothetical protein